MTSEKHLTLPDGHPLRPESLMMSYGYDPRLSEGALKCPIFQTSTFVFESAEAGKDFFAVAYGLREAEPGEATGLIYSRLNNPDLEILEDRLTVWDGAESAAVFESGMAAITTTLLAFVRPGDVLLHSEPLYGGTDHFIRHFLPELGVHPVGFAAGRQPGDLEAELGRRVAGRRIAACLVETPANPTNDLVDIAGTRALLDRLAGAAPPPPLLVDNTFLGPIWQQPLRHGADLVLYSATKFIGGHSDVIAGACLGRTEPMKAVRTLRTFMGTMAGPWTGWLLMRSLETLKMRMTAQMKNARYVADFLQGHPAVALVSFLGLLPADHPMQPVYARQCSGPGSIIAFTVHGGEPAAFRVLNRLAMIKLAVSLGGTESLAEHPGTMTHADIPPELQARMGITPGMIRLSVGVEHFEDIIADLRQALEGAAAP